MFCTIIFPINTFSLEAKLIVHSPIQRTNTEKYFMNYNIKVKMPTLVGNEQLFHSSLSSEDTPFPSSDRKWTDLIHQRWTSKCFFPRLKYEKNTVENENDIRKIIALVLTSFLFLADCQSSIFRNEEKLEALLVYSSFIRVASSGYRINRYSLVVVVVCAQMRSKSGITSYSPEHCSTA